MSIYAGDIYAPYWATYQSGAPSFWPRTIDAEGEKISFHVPAPATGTISKVHVQCVSIPIVPAADYDIRLETVGASDGLPTGTLADTNTNGALTLSSGDDDEWLPVTLTSGLTVTRGDDVTVVIQPPASPDTGDVDWATYADISYGFPYSCWHNGTIWAKAAYAAHVLLEYSDGSIPRIPNCFPWTSYGNVGFLYSDSVSSKVVGNRFKLKEDTEIVGVWFLSDMDAPDVTATLYEGVATSHRTVTIKKHHTGGTGGSITQYAGYFSPPFNASADTLYRIVFQNNYATVSGTPMSFVHMKTDPSGIEAKIWDHMPYAGLFSEFYQCASEDLIPTSWSDFTVWMGMIGPIIRSIG